MAADTLAPNPGGADVAAALERVTGSLAGSGLRTPPIEGKLLRPALALAILPPEVRSAGLDDGFWLGALAIQMVHEASLLHDDILDDAGVRRGRATAAAADGIGRALVLGDHYLTGAYAVAARAGDPVFLEGFIEAVERTVAGEIEQARHAGGFVDPGTYDSVIRGKSGALFGAAVLLARTRLPGNGAPADGPSFVDFGIRLGALYQRVDDYLDYCAATDLGKPALQDWRQRKATFVLHEAGIEDFELDDGALASRLFDGPDPVMRRALERLENEARGLVAEHRRLVGGADGALAELLDQWVGLARDAWALESALRPATSPRTVSPGSDPGPPHRDRSALHQIPASVEASVVEAARAVGGSREWPAYFGKHSKTFRFASLLFPAEARASIEGIYAYCRFTDDLVDEAAVPAPEARRRLEAWRALSRAAWEGRETGVPLLGAVMGETAAAGVPFSYVDELLTGVGMDLEPVHYERMRDLEVYTHRVASVVGGWITELFGLRDEALLRRAFAMGHAMQLTNILRDVGEDWRNHRLYLPRVTLREFGVGAGSIEALVTRGVVPERWPSLMEHLMDEADRSYALAFEAIPELPVFYGRPVTVAARVYQGIHDEIRRNGYDNGTRRAWTSLPRKALLGAGGLLELRRARRSNDSAFALARPQEI